ncbi:redox-sensing transcriptional repressor Rex [Gemmatimonadota bacterium]
MSSVSGKTIGRLCIYRRQIQRLKDEGKSNAFSHQLAALTGGSAAQVRRDLMAIGYSGTPYHGYIIDELAGSIGKFLDHPDGQQVALVGLGNLGRAILAYFEGRRPNLVISAAFDIDSAKVDRVIHGCHCYRVDLLEQEVKRRGIVVGVICVPAREAQKVAESLVSGGVKAIVNFAPRRLHLPDNVHVEDLDMTTALEKAAFFARGGPSTGKYSTSSKQ